VSAVGEVGVGDHLSGKPGNVWEIDSCQEDIRKLTNSKGNVRDVSEKNFVRLTYVWATAVFSNMMNTWDKHSVLFLHLEHCKAYLC